MPHDELLKIAQALMPGHPAIDEIVAKFEATTEERDLYTFLNYLGDVLYRMIR